MRNSNILMLQIEATVNLSLIRAKFPLSPTVDSHYKRTESLYITREPAFP